jgi:pimeloyl-ACP methyl ester carboxylesterase/predicted NAD-dependent protein-ADP-ribosyltransferase YbiA (DUF1768 family)
MKALLIAAVLATVAVTLGARSRIPELVQPQKEPSVERKTCTSADGVTLVYSAAGAADTALLFIHGGFADRSFFDAQFGAFSGRYRVVAIDLAGHGESGRNRTAWSVAAFAADVKAVVDAEGLKRVVLFGNSLGGPVAIEAALLLPGRVSGVVGIDTFQDLGNERTPEYKQREADATHQRAEAFHKDFAGSMKAMVGMLFHPDADPRLKEEAERRMMRTSPDVVYGVLAGLAGYDYTPAARGLAVPLRAINGDLFPTNVQAARAVKADFDVVVMTHMGHYPMLKRPDEFNRLAADTITALLASTSRSAQADRSDLMAARAKYPAHWWAPVPKDGAPAWEILPQEAAPGEVIVSKRHELGLLSNFAATPFVFRGIRYASLEGFWQMMLYPEGPDDPRAGFPGLVWPHTRQQVSQMTGFEAKDAGTLAEQNMSRMGIDWVTFEAERFPYRPERPGRHYDLIVAATREKVRQNPRVQQALLATGDLILRPDHHEEAGARAAWRYCDILMQIRTDLKGIQ